LLDFSRKHELSLHAELAADINIAVTALDIRGVVVGAFARDLHLHYGAGIPIQRATEDVDFALMVRDWAEFEAVRNRLIESGACQEVNGMRHRLRHRGTLAIDLVPFGSVETEDRQIKWPPNGDVVMDAFGFREATMATEEVLLPGSVRIQVVSLPALALLKIVAWEDRHRRSPGRDAPDLMLILRNYLQTETNRRRLWEEFSAWTEADDFDYEQGGARMLGHDIRKLLDDGGVQKIGAILRPQIDKSAVGELPQEMDRQSPERAQSLLQRLNKELVGG
jgi:predicted nucleotidyltransferase